MVKFKAMNYVKIDAQKIYAIRSDERLTLEASA